MDSSPAHLPEEVAWQHADKGGHQDEQPELGRGRQHIDEQDIQVLQQGEL